MSYQQLQGNRAYVLPSSATFSITSYNPISGINQPSMTSTNIGYVSYMAITQTAGALQTITFSSDILGFSVAPLVSITTDSGGGSGATATASLDASTGALKIAVTSGGTSYTNSSLLTLTLTGGTLLPSVRCQPFRVYVGSGEIATTMITAGGDTLSTVVMAAGTFPVVLQSITTGASTKTVAFW
jgi:hypothetical protein